MRTKYRGEWLKSNCVPSVDRVDKESENYNIVRNVLVAIAQGTVRGIKEDMEKGESEYPYLSIWDRNDSNSDHDPNTLLKEYKVVADYLEDFGNGRPFSLSLWGYKTVMRYLYREYRMLSFHEDRYSGSYDGDGGKRRLKAKYPDVDGPSAVYYDCVESGLSIRDMKYQILNIANQVRKENAFYTILN